MRVRTATARFCHVRQTPERSIRRPPDEKIGQKPPLAGEMNAGTRFIGVFLINGPDVRIDGCTLRNVITTGAGIGVAVKTGGKGAVITNNFIDKINTTDSGPNGAAQAVYLENGPDNVSILGNDLSGVQS